MQTNRAIATLMLLLTAACASKKVPATALTPAHPDFVYPTVPATMQRSFAAQHVDLGWKYLQIDDLRGADREFAAAL
jgi:Tfp pilus assembly protein PilF